MVPVPPGQMNPMAQVSPMAPMRTPLISPPMGPQTPISTYTQSMMAPSMPPGMVTSVASIPPSVATVPLNASYVTPGLNVSQQMMSSANFGYGMGPTVGTVVGAMNQPAYGVTAMTL